MSWLIESYLEEGKHGPDHPKQRNVRTAADYRLAKSIEKVKGNGTDDKHRAVQVGIDRLEKGEGELSKYTKALNMSQGNIPHYKQTDATARGADTILRHDRRHPDRKIVESSSDIVETMQ